MMWNTYFIIFIASNLEAMKVTEIKVNGTKGQYHSFEHKQTFMNVYLKRYTVILTTSSYFQNFSWFQFTFSMHDYVCLITHIDYCVE